MLGFKRRFAPMILDGSKRHTIRGRAAKVGETLHCYVDPRQKSMRLLGRWKCVKVEPIRVVQQGHGICVIVDGQSLSLDECNLLAWRDGFRDHGIDHAFGDFICFWLHEHAHSRDPLDWRGFINHWDYEHPADAPRTTKRRRQLAKVTSAR